jgi:hypothetical protein
MSNYDSIDGKKSGSNTKTFNGYDSLEVFAAFQYACRTCDPESALRYALEAYYSGGAQRSDIITKIFVICLEDKGLANTSLFIQIFQLMVPLLTRKEDEKTFTNKDSDNEEWKTIPSHDSFKVSNLGKFKDKKGKMLIITRKEKYNYVLLDGSYYRTDALVAETFLTKRSKLKYLEHLDGDLTDDSAENLKWVAEEPAETGKKKKKNKPSPFEYFRPLDYENLNKNPDRLTYIYRFAMAVWALASSPSSKTVAYSLLLDGDIEQEVSEENIGSYSREHGHPEQCRSYLYDALKEKNLHDCLYYAKVLHFHPEKIEDKLKWTSIKEAYIYIWDCFKSICEKAPNHISKYMLRMLSIGISPSWQKEDISRLLYSYFIHMWCLDPIAAYVANMDNVRTYTWKDEEFQGSFSYDFMKPDKAKKILGRWTKETTLNEDEELLFNISYPTLGEPTLDESLRYFDSNANKKKRYPDFNPIFELVAEGKDLLPIPEKIRSKVVSLDREINNTILDKSILKNEDPKWIPLSVFYTYLVFFDITEVIAVLVKKYGTIEEFFSKYDYPNPFTEEPDIVNTEFISFKSTILKVLGLESEEKNAYSTADPKERRRTRNKSTFEYRNIPSPVGYKSPKSESSQVIVRPRMSPLSRETSTPSQVSVKSRIVAERPETRTPNYSKVVEEDSSEEIIVPRKKK